MHHWYLLHVTGGMGRASATFYRRLLPLFVKTRPHPCSITEGWLSSALSFALLRPAQPCAFLDVGPEITSEPDEDSCRSIRIDPGKGAINA